MKAVFFDLDGTLTDPFLGITGCIQHALRNIDGLDVPPASALAWCIGPPLLQSLQQLAGTHADTALGLYRERFAEIGWRENAVYDGIPELLAQLNDAGVPLYVATSKPRVYAQRIVDHFGLARYFQRVFGAELDGTNADKSDLLATALAAIDVGCDTTMVGDRSHDIVGARNNGMRAIGVTYGYGTPEELETAGAAAVAASPAEIAPLLLNLSSSAN